MEPKDSAITIIGAGLTGLTTAYYLRQQGKEVQIIEKSNSVGGVIQTHKQNGFVFETGPNTGILKYPEVIELFEALADECSLDVANAAVKRRFILHKGKWQQLPSGLLGGIKTPLFKWKDKFRLLGEPFRKPGNDPDETLSALVKRRMGQSFLDYAVDPFILGVYAGDPELLVPRHALPKLYQLEQDYGSFIGGALKKQLKEKGSQDKKASKEVFSVNGGLSEFINALAKNVGYEKIFTGQRDLIIKPAEDEFIISTNNKQFRSKKVIMTTGAHEVPSVLPWLSEQKKTAFKSLTYARVVEVALGFNNWQGIPLNGFGGLIPHKEGRSLLGALFLSSFLHERAPKNGALLTLFLGGVRNDALVDMPDETIKKIVKKEVMELFKLDSYHPDLIHISRYQHAIPQYGQESEERFKTIEALEIQYPGLILAGNMRDGIGMADRIKQAAEVVKRV